MKDNPWKGLVPYEEKDLDKYEFCGRTRAISKLYSLITNSLISTLYGRTGCGKTSMLQAGIFPLLRQESYFPVKCRLSLRNKKTSFADYLIDCVEKEIVELGFLCRDSNVPVTLIGDSDKYKLWQYFYGHEFYGKDDNIVFPVIVLDQFEEVLIDAKDDSFKFLEQVSFLVGDDLLLPDDCYANFRITISLREDFLYLLEDTIDEGKLRGLNDNRMRLTSLSLEEAEEVISLGDEFFVNYERKRIYREICCLAENRREHISTNMLSLICSQIYQIYSDREGKKLVSLDDVKKLSKDPLRDFYNRCVKEVQEETKNFIEDSLVLNGFRKPATRLEFEAKLPKSDRDRLTSGEYKILQYITANDNECVELIHDTLARAVFGITKETEVKINIEKSRNTNYKRFLSRQNPLTLAGRQIWDNKTFSFTVDNSRSTSLNNSSNRTEILKDLLQQRNRADDGVEHLFFEKLFRQTEKASKICLDFNGSCSKDGISIMEIETERVGIGKQLKIKKIIFKDSRNELFYTIDGFCGIICDYDKETGNEIKRKYICDGFTSACVVGVKFEKFNEYGFPTKVSYFDSADNPCKHIDGNYGVQIEYDNCGHETCRWFLDQYGEKTPIYNGVYGIVHQYDGSDRVTKQYFINSKGKRVYDNYGFHGINIKYNEAPNELLASETLYIDENDSLCNGPQGYCIERLQYDDKGRVIWQTYLDKDRNAVEKKDGVYFYSKLEIGYNESDKPDNLEMYNLSGNSIKIVKCSYNANGSISEYSFYESKKSQYGQIERKSVSDENTTVHKIKFTHDNHGVLISQQYFDKNDNSTKDCNHYDKIEYLYNELGIFVEHRLYDFQKSKNEPVCRQSYKYLSDDTCEMTEYEIRTETKTAGKILGAIYKKKEEKNIVEKEKTSIKGSLNHRLEFIRLYLDEDNNLIPGVPLTVRKKYDIDGNVIEELYYDVNDKSPIYDESGAYGWRMNDNKTEYLGKNVIIECSSEVHKGESYSVTAYYDKDCKPIVCKEGYHKKIETTDSSYDVLCKQVYYFDSNGKLCDCVDGYARQLFEKEEAGEYGKIIVSFWGVDGTPRLNKGLGFHKRELIIANLKGKDPMEVNRSFKDENDKLINVHEGFAKQTCKRYDSFWTLFYYPFQDHDIIRFYDENDQKVDVDYKINGKIYQQAYKFMVPLDWSSSFKVTNSSGEILYREKSVLWRCINVIWIPPAIVLLLFVALLYEVLKWVYGLFRPNHNSTIETCAIIRVADIFEKVQIEDELIQAPIRQFDVEEGCWIVKWNNWSYDSKQDVATAFETEFNNSSERKLITFYHPDEKEFLNVDITSPNIGLRIQEAQVPIKEVEEMIVKWNKVESRND